MFPGSEHSWRNQLRGFWLRGLPRMVPAIILVMLPWMASPARAVAQDVDSIPKADGPVHRDPQNGKRLYDRCGCYQCHGGQGQGSILTGPRIGPNPTGFSGFVRYIRQPGGEMPPYTSKIVSDAELTDIYAFLQSLPPPQSAKKIPLLISEPRAEKK